MSMDRNLFLAILAMDSYNRGYGFHITGLTEEGKLGNATLLTAPSQAGWEDAGFYAIAYQLPSGYIAGLTGKVISYRGTNFDPGDSVLGFFSSPLWSDIRSGWSVGAGWPGGQAELALEFYKGVAGDDADPRYANITTTGHSLGGGLAGLAANVYNRDAVLFDHMPYAPVSVALRAYLNAREKFFGGEEIWDFSADGISALSTTGEILSFLRLEHATSAVSEVLERLGFDPIPDASTSVDSHGGLRNPVTLHSMALLVNLLWAQENEGEEWQSAAPQLWNGYFDSAIADTLPGISGRVGVGSTSSAVMGEAIAYSALGRGAENEGEKPFGDTAIWSMFDDAGELGKVLEGGAPAFFDQLVYRTPSLLNLDSHVDVKQHLANFLVQYAGALALYDVEQADGGSIDVEGGTVDAREGILSADTADSALALDLSRQLWSDVLKSNPEALTKLQGDRLDPIERQEFLKEFLEQANDKGFFSRIGKMIGIKGSSDWDEKGLAALAEKVWGTGNLDIFDRFHMAREENPTRVVLDARGYQSNISDGEKAQVDFYIGSSADETIVNETEGHSLIITAGGTDIVHAGAGDDVLVSTGGNDKLYGDDGDDIVFAISGSNALTVGGLGRDLVINETKGGVIWGDIENSVLQADGTRYAWVDGERITILDDSSNADLFSFAPNTVLMDAQFYDKIRFHGITLTGGDAAASSLGFALGFLVGGATKNIGTGLTVANAFNGTAQLTATLYDNKVYFDHLLPFISYKRQGNDLLISNMITGFLSRIGEAFGVDDTSSGTMLVKDYFKGGGALNSTIWGTEQFIDSVASTRKDIPQNKLNFAFKDPNPLFALANLISLLPPIAGSTVLANVYKALALADSALGIAGALLRNAKGLEWIEGSDPLIIDLDGDGVETLGLWDESIYFDVDGDLFAERTGWLKGDDGFLVLDANGNGRIDDVSEMFGGVGVSGFEELATLDSDGDGKITMADALWSELQVWQDYDRDGVTDAGELKTLDELGIVSLDVNPTAFDATTSQGARLTGYGDVVFADGARRTMFDAILASNDTDTRYAGESGLADWQAGNTLDAKGFGTITDLSVAMANDVALEELATATAAGMTAPNLRTLVAQAGDVLGKWGASQELTRELAPVLVGTDETGAAVLVDRGIYVEDADGGYWTLASGDPVLDADGAAIDRPTLADVMGQAGGQNAQWRLEQQWSPSDRAAPLEHREAAPYLMTVVDGRAVILDYGIEQADGSWALASDPATTYASRADILALGSANGAEWRVEELGHNPLAALPVERIGVRFTDGQVVDYTVEVTDRDGTFYVWARNLDRAIELEWKTGDYREFNLRNYAIDFDTLDEVNSTDDSTYRVEMLTPEQFHFAVSLGGVEFRPEMLSATLNYDSGTIDYAVGPGGSANLSTDPARYESGIGVMIEMLEPVMAQYITASRRFAVRLAMQGGLSDYAAGFEYDVASDSYKPTTDRQLAPLFEAIFAAAPASNDDDAVLDYLTDWNEILWQIYPDYAPENGVSIDQVFIMQMLIPAFENVGVDLDLRGVAHALSIDETRILTHGESALSVEGTDGVDFFYLTAGDQAVSGGGGADFYFVGGDAGSDVIHDQDDGDTDELRFTDVNADQVTAIRDGQDLILEIEGRTNKIRLTNQFLGELNGYLSNGKQLESGVTSIVFADGVVWDRFRMAMEVVDKARAEGDFNDSLLGSGSGDVLWGGKGNDYMSGGAGGDFYIFEAGDGSDVIDDQGAFSFGPVKAGIDFLRFRGAISADNLKLIRDGASENLKIVVLDDEGNETGDRIEIVGQFGGIRLNLGIFGEALGSSDGLDYVAPNLIERFIFEDGTSLDFTQIVERVLENAKTENDDAIYGFINDNVLDGGAGDDYLTGIEGSDTYIFGRGYDHDVVEDADFSFNLFGGPGNDRLEFVDDIRWTDLDFLRDGPSDTLTMRIKGTDDQVTLTDLLKRIPIIGYVNLIENIEFGDGTEWSVYKLLQHYVDIAATDGDDTIYGFNGISDVLDGKLGDDRLIGFGGNDRYILGRGKGNDTVVDSGGTDRIVLEGLSSLDVEIDRTALDLVFTVKSTGERIVFENQYVREGTQSQAVEYFEFTDRTVDFRQINPDQVDLIGTNAGETITGSNFGELLDGRGGDDLLIGGDGGDTYKFDVGYGQDVIVDTRIRSYWQDRPGVHVPVNDTIEFGGDITRDNIVFTKDGNDLLISILGRTDTLRVRNQFRSPEDEIEQFKFFDGSVMKISDVEEQLAIAGGNRGDNVIEGVLDAPNTLDGRQGDDTLIGGHKADTYAFTSGYGFDRIAEKADAAGTIDRVIFGSSVRLEDVRFTREDTDLVISLGNGLDVLTIVGGLANTSVERFEFADGTMLSLDAAIDRMLTGTDEDEQLTGFDNRDDTISGGAGSDAMAGGKGNDTYRFGLGDGSDSISDTGGVDRIVFGDQITQDIVQFGEVDGDLLITVGTGEDRLIVFGGYKAKPVETFEFFDGTSLSLGEVRQLIFDGRNADASETIDLRDLPQDREYRPEGGNDRILMAQGARVVIGAGDGIDSVEMPSGVTAATLVLEAQGASTVEVRLAGVDSNDLVISSTTTGDQVVLRGALGTGAVPTIEFGDGTSWNVDQLTQAYIQGQSSDFDDVISGSNRDDTIAGGLGNDQIQGRGGNDTYLYRRGDGRDVVSDTGGTDTLSIAGYRPDELLVSRVDTSRQELVLGFVDSDDEIVLRYGSNWNGVDTVRFGDGSVLSRTDLLNRVALSATEGDDVLTGTSGADILRGRQGDDILRGNGGADEYLFGRGDGQDRIESTGALDGLAIVRFDAGIALEDVSASYDRDGNVVLSLAGGNDSVTLVTPPAGDAPVVGGVVFADGRELSFADIVTGLAATNGDDTIDARGTQPVSLAGLSGHDRLSGGDAADALRGGTGDDVLAGRSGGDLYLFERGDGQDVIDDVESIDAAAVDTLRFGAGIAASEIVFLEIGPDDLVLGIAGTDDRITLRNMFKAGSATTDYGIERVEFADGSFWDYGELLSRAIAGTSGDDAIKLGGEIDLDVTLEGGAGDDVLAGGMGRTTYRFGRGQGYDTVAEFNWSGSYDTVALGADIAPDDIVMQIDGNDLVLRIRGDEARLRLADQRASGSARIDRVLFADGSEWSAAQLASRALSATAAEAALYPAPVDKPFSDPLFGIETGGGSDDQGGLIVDVDDAASEAIEGIGSGLYTRRLSGVDDTNTYSVFVTENPLGDGVDTVVNFRAGDTGDRLAIGVAEGLEGEVAAINSDGDTLIYFVPAPAANLRDARLLLRLSGVATTQLTDGNFSGLAYSLVAAETVNGTGNSDVLAGGLGNDRLNDYWGNDRFQGNGGNDTIIGGPGNDTYVFNLGDGRDTISDQHNNYAVAGGGYDTIEFGPGITWDMLEFSTSGSSFIIEIAGTDDRIVWQNGFGDSNRAMERFLFADGSTRTYAEAVAVLTQGTDGNDVLRDDDNNGLLRGEGGDNSLYGGAGSDRLVGGTGDDYLDGSTGNDTYVFNLGDGRDTIFDQHSNYAVRSGGYDTIEFGEGITWEMLSFRRSGADIVIEIPSSGDQIVWKNGYNQSNRSFEELRFADGSSYSYADVVETFGRATEGDDTMIGTGGANTLEGGLGNDSIDAGGGNDILDGGLGNDWLRGSSGNDVYRFVQGFGQDVISEAGGSSFDAIEFDESFSVETLLVTRSGNNLVLGFSDRDDRITIELAASNSDYRIEETRFADGAILTHADLMARVDLDTAPTGLAMVGLAGAQKIVGTEDSEVLYARNFDSSAELVGAGGYDELYGSDHADILVGGRGNDYLSGGQGADVYRFAAGSGHDRIYDTDYGNIIEFGPGIDAADLIVEGVVLDGDGRYFDGEGELRIAGTDDRIDLDLSRIALVRFADGTTLDRDDLLDRALPPGSLDLEIVAGRTPTEDTLVGGAGDDVLIGGELVDTLDGGAGNDVLDGGSYSDILTGGTGNDLLIGGPGFDVYRFSLGFGSDTVQVDDYRYDWIEFDETITPDMVIVSDGTLGFGGMIPIGAIPIELGRPIFFEATDIVLQIAGTEDRITIPDIGHYFIEGGPRLAGIRFADGTVWSHEDIMDRVGPMQGERVTVGDADDIMIGGDGNDSFEAGKGDDAIHGGGGADFIDAGDGDDFLDGGAGRDVLIGGAGSDTYVFGLGSGVDEIVEEASDAGIDVINIVGFDPTQIGVYTYTEDTPFLPRNGLILRSLVSDDALQMFSFGGDPSELIEQIRFEDGTIWTAADLLAMAQPLPGVEIFGDETDAPLAGGTGDDRVVGGSGNETIDGGAGNDELFGNDGDDILTGGEGADRIYGGGGADTYRFSAGFGDDILDLYEQFDLVDTIEFDATVSVADVRLEAGFNPFSFRLSVDGSSDVVTINEFGENDRIVFADGTIWGRAEIDERMEFLLDETFTGGVGSGYDGTEGSDEIGPVIPFEPGPIGPPVDGPILLMSEGPSDEEIRPSEGPSELDFGPPQERPTVGTRFNGYGGHDKIYATDGDDTIDGGTGDDELHGYAGADTYVFDAGYGQDRIHELDDGSINIIQLGSGLSLEDLIVVAIPSEPDEITEGPILLEGDIALRFAGSEDRLTLTNAFGGIGYEIRFADGTVLNSSDLFDRMTFEGGAYLEGDPTVPLDPGTDADEHFTGTPGDDLIDAGGGNDTVLGGDGDDIIIGGTGSDLLQGGAGNDTYRFSAGFGHDVILEGSFPGELEILSLDEGPNPEFGDGSPEFNIVEFDATIDPADVTVRAEGGEVGIEKFYLSFANGTDRLQIGQDYFGDPIRNVLISEYRFADGTVWTHDDVVARAVFGRDPVISTPSSGAQITGTAGSDTLLGTAGDDVMTGDFDQIYAPTGDNLIVNGSFEEIGPDPTTMSWGLAGTTLPGWTLVGPEPAAGTEIFQHVVDGYNGITGTDGLYWLDMDGGGAQNVHIEQSIEGLSEGELVVLNFDRSN